MFELFLSGVLSNLGMLWILNNKGEAGEGGDSKGDAGKGQSSGGDERTFTQEDVNRLINRRYAELKSQYEDYDELKEFKQKHEKELEQRQQQELEEQKEFEKLKENFQSKESEYKNLLTQKEQSIRNMKIENALNVQLGAYGAYPEALYELKQKAVLTDDGQVKIKGKDANGIDAELDVSDGVKNFLDKKPYLVKAQGKSGGDTGAGAGDPGLGGKSGDDLASLNDQYQKALFQGDHKGAAEIKKKMSANFSNRGVTRTP